MPQVTRTVKAADEITTLMEGPVRATAPRIERIVETLGSPGFMTLPTQIGELMQRLGPLAQLAENAGGLFGAFRMPGMPKPGSSTHDTHAAALRRSARQTIPPFAPSKRSRGIHESTASKKAVTNGREQDTPRPRSPAGPRPPSSAQRRGATPAN